MSVSMAKQKKVIDAMLPMFIDEEKNPLKFTPTQKAIIYAITLKTHHRVGIIAPTQYGKSTSIAIGVILRAMITPEKFIIVGGTKAKASIIMGCIIDHLFDNKGITSQIGIDGGSIERLRRERSRDHITFKSGGEVKIISAENRNTKRVGEMLLGEGAKNVIVDDSVLCDDNTYAYIKRLVGGHKENFLLESANPLKRNHFYRTMTSDSLYHTIWINYVDALKEGRFTESFIAEMRKEMFFNVFYECKFPAETDIDEKGYQRLLTDDEVDDAVAPVVMEKDRNNKIGVDVGRGGNSTTIILRNDTKAKILLSEKTPSIMDVVGLSIKAMQDWDLRPNMVALDDTGLGGGATDRLRELNYSVTAVVLGAAAEKVPDSKIQYKNVRAMCYWRLKEWITTGGGKIADNDNLVAQLKLIKYRIDSSGNIQIQPKEDMLMASGESPDESDALSLTFANNNVEAAYAHDKRQNKTSFKNGAW